MSKIAGFPDGFRLSLTYDTTSCSGNTDHQIIHGRQSDLPAALGGTYGLQDPAKCDIGTATPFIWSGTPPAVVNDFVWFLTLAEDNASTEGSWGKDSSVGERTGPVGLDGNSGKCGITSKSLVNICGQL